MVTSHAQPSSARRDGMRFLPRTALGWWGLGLMVVAALAPVAWAVLTPLIKSSDPEATRREVLMAVMAAPGLVVGLWALSRRASRSIALVAATAVVAVELAWLVWFLVAF